MKARTESTDAERKAVEEFLKPIADATRDIYGSRIRLTECLSALVGAEIARQTVQRWLTDDTEKRMEPKLGIALLLMKAFRQNRRSICKPWPGQERRKPRGRNKPKALAGAEK